MTDQATATPWTWRDFEREARTALEPFAPAYVCLNNDPKLPSPDSPVWPDEPPYTSWIACYAVPGASEGWHVYVDLMREGCLDRRLLMLSAKFCDPDDALKAAEALTRRVWTQEW